MLGVMAVLNWYRREKTGLVIIPIGGHDFDDWYGEIEFKQENPPYYLSLWLENSQLKADIITVHTLNPTSPRFIFENEVYHLALFAQAMESLFEKSAASFILTPWACLVFVDMIKGRAVVRNRPG